MVDGADLAPVWCLKPQSVAAVVVGTVVALAYSLQNGPAEEAEAAAAAATATATATATAAAAAAADLESGCCSAAAI